MQFVRARYVVKSNYLFVLGYNRGFVHPGPRFQFQRSTSAIPPGYRATSEIKIWDLGEHTSLLPNIAVQNITTIAEIP